MPSVTDGFPGVVPVRDSKTPTTTASTLLVSAGAWQAFIELVRR